MVGGGLGTVVFVVLALMMGADPGAVLNEVAQNAPQQQGQEQLPDDPKTKELKRFVSVVLADTEDVWHELFQQQGKTYRNPKLVMFSGQVDSACGRASASMGPFYCPADSKVYIDLRFYDEMKTKFKSPGDFAQAYVIAHEIGHHVQNVTGISSQVRRLQQENPDDANDLSIRQELQADCLAGVWGYSTYQRDILESGDLEEGLGAAAAVGDDRIQKTSTGQINPDTWTHGSSEQRMKWFRIGFDTGDPAECDTFSGNY